MTTPTEHWDKPIWRQIPGFPIYWLSDDGRIFNMRTKHLIKITTNRHGTEVVWLYGNKDPRGGRTFGRTIKALTKLTFGKEL